MTRLRRMILSGGLLVGICLVVVSAFGILVLPNASQSAYLEAKRWIGAAVHVERLPKDFSKKSEDLPCGPRVEPKWTASANEYFPRGILGCGDRQEALLIDWYSEQLKALQEPSLWALSQSDSHVTTYRFLWLRSFGPPISIRVVVKPDWTGDLVSKVGSGTGGHKPGTLARNVTQPIGKHGTTLLFTLVNQTRFWVMPSRREQDGLDGAEWIIEGVSSGRYHVVDRWSPAVGDPVRTLGMTLAFDLAQLKLSNDLVY